MTNDGGLARVLELPATGWLRRYRVRAHGRVDQAQLDTLSGGVTLDGVDYAGIEARLDREQGSNAWITMGLREGKNREIKKVLEHLGLAVNRLIRISFGPFELGDLAEGEVAEVRTRVLRDQLGAKLAREAGADFDAPIVERAPPAAPVAEPREERKGRREGPARERPGPGRGRDEERGRRFEKDAAPRPSPPAPSTPERRRKHVSALRAEIAADAAGSRKRIARSATQDRKGRTIAVERISPAGEEARKRAAEVTRKPRDRAKTEGRRGASGARGASNRSAKRPSGHGGRIRPARNGRATAKDASGRRARNARAAARPPGVQAARAAPGDAGRPARRKPIGSAGRHPREAPRRRAAAAEARASVGLRDDRRPPRGAPREDRSGRSQGERGQGERGGKFGGSRSFGGKASPGRAGRPPGKGPPKGPGAGPRRPPRKP